MRAAAALTATAGAGLGTPGVARTLVKHYHAGNAFERDASHTEPFLGAHQGGIITPPQRHTYLAALDLATEKRDEVMRLLRAWTTATARMTRGEPAPPTERAAATVLPDSGEAHGLPPARLTLTFGFGAGLFLKDGKDRYGLAAQRPPALVDLPPFDGDQLIETRTGGDLSIQACAEDPQVAFHAVRQLVRLAYGVAIVRWAQTGFLSIPDPHQTPRNLMGFKDGTTNPSIHDAGAMERFVWVGDEGPDWMHGGSYVVLRRIRIALEHWDRMPLEFQEQSVGRHKNSGAPLGRDNEFDPPDLTATGNDGDLLIPESAHIRLAAAASNEGAQILRRPYSYNDGVDFTIERWPPWRRGVEYDAGLLFVCYQRDLRTGFIKIFDKLANGVERMGRVRAKANCEGAQSTIGKTRRKPR